MADSRRITDLVPLWLAAALYAAGAYALLGPVCGAGAAALLFVVMWAFARDYFLLNHAPTGPQLGGGFTRQEGIIEAFVPASEYHRENPAPEEEEEAELCVVCISALRDGEMVRRLPACGHTFHAPCIDRWLRASTTCPLCVAVVGVAAAAGELPEDEEV